MIIVIYVSDDTIGMGAKQHTNDDLTTLNFVSHITITVVASSSSLAELIYSSNNLPMYSYHHCYQPTHFVIGHAGFTSCYSLLSCVLVTNIYT